VTIDWAALEREEFGALAGLDFCNLASVGPIPSRAVRIIDAMTADRARPDRWPKDRIDAIFAESRATCARLVNASVDEIALMPNTTTGLNIAARALPLAAGDVVLTFDKEFPSNVYPWIARAAEGIVLERIPCTAEGWPDEARLHERLQAPEVKAVCVSLTQFSNGYTVDLDALSRATRARGIWLVVDAIQAAGQVPIDVQRTPVDFLACGAQKWLLSPWGTGFLYVRRELIARFPPTFAGWTAYHGTDDFTQLTAYDPRPWDDARRYELITLPIHDFAVMNASVGLILDVGVAAIQARMQARLAPWIEWAEATGATITSPRGTHGSGILCIRPREPVAEVVAALAARGVVCSVREGAVRLSPMWGQAVPA
jgi:cysteine desulfurase / selenocysteine lyase